MNTNNTLIENKLASRAYRSGLLGSMSLLVVTVLLHNAGFTSTDHIRILNVGALAHVDIALFVLLCCGTIMFLAELYTCCSSLGKDHFQIHPKLRKKQFLSFMCECFGYYAIGWLFLEGITALFQHTSEYGFQAQRPYYQPFFHLLDLGDTVYRVFAFPYIGLTRAFHYQEHSQHQSLSAMIGRLMLKCINLLAGKSTANLPTTYRRSDRSQWLGILVKIFFIPLMTVFFTVQFGHVMNNIGFLQNLVTTNGSDINSLRTFTKDVYNIIFSVLIMIDTGIAWCGYVISSKWIRNQVITAEPRLFGWVVAIMCYPPFNGILGAYLSKPAENSFLQIDYDLLMFLVCMLSLIAYGFYTLSTIWFGMRFSNLTHRGIITSGPYGFIRHPAYATKNFAWWCLMFPQIIWITAGQNLHLALTQVAGLVGMSLWYYARAVTEEQHLSWDPAYLEYCRKVRYRFIPGVL